MPGIIKALVIEIIFCMHLQICSLVLGVMTVDVFPGIETVVSVINFKVVGDTFFSRIKIAELINLFHLVIYVAFLF